MIHISILVAIFASITNPKFFEDYFISMETNTSLSDQQQENSLTISTTKEMPKASQYENNFYPPIISEVNTKDQTLFIEFPSIVDLNKHNLALNATGLYHHRKPDKPRN